MIIDKVVQLGDWAKS